MLSALFLVFALICVLIIYDRVKYGRLYKLLAKFPGPKPIPLIGSAYNFRSTEIIIENYLKYFYLHGPTILLWLFRVPVVVVSEPKHLKIVLNSDSCLDKEKRYEVAREIFGNGLLVAPANKWKKTRKIVNPALNQQILNSFVPIFSKYSEKMLKDIENDIPENKPFDVDLFIIKYSMDIIIQTFLGIDEEIPRPDGFGVSSMQRITKIISKRAIKVWLHPDFIFRLSPLGREFYKLSRKLNDYCMKLLEKRYNTFHSQDKDKLSFDDNNKKPYLDRLLSIGKEFTIEELKHEVVVIFVAGIDTSAAALGYFFLCLGVYKDIQEKVFEELLDVFGDSDRPICVEDLPKLQYLERALKESMRIFPSVPLFARSVVEDIDIGDYIIPKGVSLLISVIATHRNEKYWPDPLKFDPDRFLPSEVAKRPPYSYLPFSAGPRNCIGLQYAMMSMKVMAASILRKYKIDTDIKLENIRANLQIVARIIGGANISIERRHKM